ncbi:hypothetical protein [Flagellimonas eckloniae]|uniref:Uncharacterized protein n=1 Tax=Flagellimonas eckloniae TaxID=346185 RepID=A0A0Q0XLR2_9FLAO|nr:hypothetical protein [Allomuricauda eckloniae]KQC29952.1 hypothetical protein AAY42_08705 [Allomuricauda eckloniae]
MLQFNKTCHNWATQLALYRKTKNKNYQNKTVSQLLKARDYWKKYTETAMLQNINPIWTNRVGHVDWMKAIDFADLNVTIAGKD